MISLMQISDGSRLVVARSSESAKRTVASAMGTLVSEANCTPGPVISVGTPHSYVVIMCPDNSVVAVHAVELGNDVFGVIGSFPSLGFDEALAMDGFIAGLVVVPVP
jgi:hypothetical protein